MSWYALIVTLHDLGGEACHALGSEWRKKRYHFVENASERPDVTQMVVWLFFPHLWTSIVWSTRLRLQEASLGYLRHVEVSKLDDTFLRDEQIGTLDVSVNYL